MFLAGATLPYSAVALGLSGSLIAGGVGVVGGYLGGTAANKRFNPLDWDWKSPETIGGLFNGFTSGFSIVRGISGINASLGKHLNVFISANKNTFTAVAVAFGYGYERGMEINDGNLWFWEWNYSEDNIAVTLGAIFNGFSTGIATSAMVTRPTFNDVKDVAGKPPSNWLQHHSEDLKNLMQKLPPKVAATMVGAIGAFHAVGGAEIQDIFDFKNFDYQKVASTVTFLETFFEDRNNHLQSLELQKSLAVARKAIREDEKMMIAKEREAKEKKDETVSEEEFYESNRDESSRKRRETRSILWNPREIANFQGFPSVLDSRSSSNFNSSSFNVLDMGDKWMQQTETIGNLTLLNLLVDKLFNSSKSQKKEKNNSKFDIECQILSAEVVNEYAEKFVELAEEYKISDYLANETLEKVVDLPNLTRKVKTEIQKKDFKAVLKLFKVEFAEKSLNFLRSKVTSNQIDQLQKYLKIELLKVQEKLEKSEEKKHAEKIK